LHNPAAIGIDPSGRICTNLTGGPTVFRELRALGASVDVAAKVAASSRRWWHNSDKYVNLVLTNAYFDRFGIPRLC